jgi:Nucleotidyl transferase AbiEii toxin, Type IV TA system
MNWEDSKACTPLKRDFLRAWFDQEQRFFLTGGSALGLFYLDHRLSYDLDLFTSEDVDRMEVQNLVYRVADAIGAECVAVRTTPDFRRFKLTRELVPSDLHAFLQRLRLAMSTLALPPQ